MKIAQCLKYCLKSQIKQNISKIEMTIEESKLLLDFKFLDFINLNDEKINENF